MIAAGLGALAIGLALGFLGSGGSILAVPVLIYLLGQEEKTAIVGSLAVVGAVAAAGAIEATVRRAVAWRAAGLFAVTGLAGSTVGALAGARSAGATQVAVFGFVALAAALAMAFRRAPDAATQPGAQPTGQRSAGKMAIDGFLVGLLTGYVGVGGGFLIVPALTLLGGLPMVLATGTSLVVIAVNAGSGFAWSLVARPQLAGTLDWQVLGVIASIGMVGSLAGRRLARRFEDRALRRAFAVALVLLAVFVLRDALPRALVD